ncbi:GNAT family N-acetyltransferase [Litchfieldia salsa]|uniref:Acetyltransferase (GNAT) domain-containing protein n=1 Tax=Litchfieldia salsa TaxID=930152 RepID=A0A1H0SXN1_9BACI|nr:GNAT family N-acetyltransferase [Litchfieldia salsa]SDP46379.1 Acetyltransferase (GNAT) domain-containing protein [Litchfieldia salsa]
MVEIKSAKVENYRIITELYEELIKEICEKTNTELNLPAKSQSLELCKQYLESETYKFFVAEIETEIVGFISVCSSYSLYAGGEFGVIQEFFVRPSYRSLKIGSMLLAKANEYGKQVGWKRLEVATPPLPQFDKSFVFYKNNGFIDGEGRKMKLEI